MLSPCNLCNRHVRDDELCPFCGREDARQARRSSSLGLAVAAATAGVALGGCGDTKPTEDIPQKPAVEATEVPLAAEAPVSDAAAARIEDATAKIEAADAAVSADVETKPTQETSTDDAKTAKEKAAAAKRKKARDLAEQRRLEREAAKKPKRPERPMVPRYGIRPRQLQPKIINSDS